MPSLSPGDNSPDVLLLLNPHGHLQVHVDVHLLDRVAPVLVQTEALVLVHLLFLPLTERQTDLAVPEGAGEDLWQRLAVAPHPLDRVPRRVGGSLIGGPGGT